MIILITIKDVAKAANVSVATVSRAINNDKNISQDTRNYVMNIIDKLGYTPNVLGRNLRISQTKRVLILLPDSANPFYPEVLKGINSVADEAGFLTMISCSNSEVNREKLYINQVLNKSYDGLILASSQLSAEELSAFQKRAPIVMFCEYVDNADVMCVTIDNRKAEFEAINYLILKGHKRIGLIANDTSYSGKERIKGYIDAHVYNRLPVREEYIIRGGYKYSCGMDGTKQLMRLSNPPTAIAAITDFLSLGVNNYLAQSEDPICKTVEIFGFDNTPIANIIHNAINTVAQPGYEIGKRTMELLLQKINGNKEHNEMVFLEHSLLLKHE
ncbi:MAG: LacI family DNA-binding transcriptional regulator [Bacillota bacterium]|nr:LacI family DNA-binding transcriptional regulator [Bacillota bacterium]